MEKLFTRRFYVYFGCAGLLMDLIGHIAQNDFWTGVSQVVGYRADLWAAHLYWSFGLGMAAHAMFLVAFALLAVRVER